MAALRLSGLFISGFYARLFARMLAGAVLVVSSTAIYYTHGRTVMLGMLVLAGCLLYFSIREVRDPLPIQSGKQATKILLAAVALFLICFLRCCLAFNPGIPYLPHADMLFYANISNFISQKGVENISFDYLDFFPDVNDPYHYFDIWFNAAVFRLAGLNALTSFILITVSFFLFTCWCGLMALAERLDMKPVQAAFLSLGFLFFSGAWFPFYGKIPWLAHADIFCTDLFYYTKLTVVAVFMLAAVLLYLHQKLRDAALVLLMIPVSFISTAPAVLAGVITIIIWLFVSNRKKDAWQVGAAMAALVAFMFVFYRTDQPGQVIRIREINAGSGGFFTLSYLKTCINITGLSLIQVTVIFFPFILLLYAGRKHFRGLASPLTLVVTVMAATGLLSWAALHYMLDTVQLFSNITTVLLMVVTFSLTVRVYAKAGPVLRSIMMALFAIFFLYKINFRVFRSRYPYMQSEAYLEQTAGLMHMINPVGVFMRGDSTYRNVFAKNPTFEIAGKHLAFTNSNAYTYSISVFDTPVNDINPGIDRQLMARSVFYWFVKHQQENGTFRTIHDSQVEFIRQYRPGYLIADKGVQPDSSLIGMTSSVIVDSQTGEQFFVFDPEKMKR